MPTTLRSASRVAFTSRPFPGRPGSAQDTPVALDILTNDDQEDAPLTTVTFQNVPALSTGVFQYTDAAGAVQTVIAGTAFPADEAATFEFVPDADFVGDVLDAGGAPITYTLQDADGDDSNANIGPVDKGLRMVRPNAPLTAHSQPMPDRGSHELRVAAGDPE